MGLGEGDRAENGQGQRQVQGRMGPVLAQEIPRCRGALAPVALPQAAGKAGSRPFITGLSDSRTGAGIAASTAGTLCMFSVISSTPIFCRFYDAPPARGHSGANSYKIVTIRSLHSFSPFVKFLCGKI